MITCLFFLRQTIELILFHTRLCYLLLTMTSTIQPKRKRGPPATGKGLLVGVRLQPPQLKMLDAWIESQSKKMSRPEAVRKILADALGDR